MPQHPDALRTVPVPAPSRPAARPALLRPDLLVLALEGLIPSEARLEALLDRIEARP